MSQYHDVIREFSPDHDPRHIEAVMRLKFGSLDRLSRADFERESAIARMVVGKNPERAEELAQQFGL